MKIGINHDIVETRCPVTGWLIRSRPEWRYAEKDFAIRYEVLNGRIVHSVAEGYLREDYVQQVYDLRQKILEDNGLTGGFEGFISNFGALTGISYRARLKYIKLLKRHYRQVPFNSFTVYGASRWQRAAVKLSSVFLPVKTAVARDYAAAVALIAENESDLPPEPTPKPAVERRRPEVPAPDPLENFLEELYIYIGSIDWRKKGFEDPVDISPQNPLRPVVDMIDFVKGEVDELFEEKQLSEDALLQSREQYRALLGAIPDPVVIYDAQGNATYVNQAFEKVYGWKKEDLLGGQIDFVPPEEVENTRAGWEQVLKKGQTFLETRRYNRSGRELDIQASSASIRNHQGEHIASIVIHRDVSERRRAEKTMNQQFKYLSALHQTTLGLISRRDLNDLLKTIVARSAELVGVPYGFIYLYDPDTESLTLKVGTGMFKDLIGRRIKPGLGLAGKTWETGEPIAVNDYQHWEGRDPDAKWDRIQAVAGIPIKSKTEVIGVIGVSDDSKNTQITGNEIGVLTRLAQLTAIAIENARLYHQMEAELAQRKRAQEELRTSHRNLEEAKGAAEAATRAKSEFLANMSHEIRTPMNAIIGFTRLLLEMDVSSRQREYLELIRGSSDILLHLINDILDFSKIEAGKLDLERKPFQIQAVMENLYDICPDKPEESDIELVVDVHPDIPLTLVGDEIRLKQVLLNLISNAMKFTDKGEVIVRVQVKAVHDRQIELDFSVTDTGIGIHPEQVPYLFDSFAQADASTTRTYGGTGLGLAICKTLVQMMQGNIRVKSRPGKGSCFSFTARFDLPEKEPQPTPLPPVREDPVDGLSGLHILLVEDNVINQRLAVSILEAAGIDADTAGDGREAVDAVDGSRYDAVLMDIHMPNMDGYAATRIIRKIPRCGDLPIIAMTADVMAGAREKCLEAGMNDYVAKPVDHRELFAALGRWTRYRFQEKSDGGPGDTASAEPGGPALPFKLPGIDVRAGLHRLGGNQALFIELLQDFCEMYADLETEIERLLDNGDADGARRLVHTIKGTAGNLSAVRMELAATELEKCLAGDGSDRLPELINTFSEALKQLQRSLERLGAG